MRFASLGSGSRGNATVVEAGATRVLVDCGFAAREAERRPAEIGVCPADLDAILVTHEHGDHVRGVATLANRHGIAVWSTPGTWRQAGGGDVPGLRLLSGHEAGFRIGDLRVAPFPVPHDAREPCQFVFEGGGRRLGMLTDAGSITPHIRDLLRDCDALLLECNHDSEMLRQGPYPPSLQARVGGSFGHLSNLQAADLLDALPHAMLRHLLVAHISEKNNHPSLARTALLEVSSDLEDRLVLAEQDRPSPWLSL
ncbi:MAG: MBL fold metallo-hydrolase [Pseudomonadota bacterium]|nr:MBL fold metallo-hydrolase [Pseudomonadota bacterium]